MTFELSWKVMSELSRESRGKGIMGRRNSLSELLGEDVSAQGRLRQGKGARPSTLVSSQNWEPSHRPTCVPDRQATGRGVGGGLPPGVMVAGCSPVWPSHPPDYEPGPIWSDKWKMPAPDLRGVSPFLLLTSDGAGR